MTKHIFFLIFGWIYLLEILKIFISLLFGIFLALLLITYSLLIILLLGFVILGLLIVFKNLLL